MKCPVCQKEMVTEDFGGVKVDVCVNGCKSMWFDWQELIRLDENKEGFGEALNQALKYPRVNDASRGPLNCPKCGIPMHTHKYKSAKEVNVDECYSCGGFFLDSGELSEIRENFMSEQERKEYCQQLLQGIPEYVDAKVDLSQRSAAIGSWTKIFARAKIK
jgi:Zn-finger nucleic acid-binding protein